MSSAPIASATGWPAAHETFALNQGRFTGRPSILHVRPDGTRDDVRNVAVGGDVALVGRGTIEVLP